MKNIRYEIQITLSNPRLCAKITSHELILHPRLSASLLTNQCTEEEQNIYFCGIEILATGVRSDAGLRCHSASLGVLFKASMPFFFFFNPNEELAFSLRQSF